MDLILQREPERCGGTPGTLKAGAIDYTTVELPWRQNAHNVSCIPPGKYRLKLVPGHPHLGNCIEVLSVPDRDAIFMHVANWPSDVEGCIGVGLDFAPYKHQLMIVHSHTAMLRLYQQLKNSPDPLLRLEVLAASVSEVEGHPL